MFTGALAAFAFGRCITEARQTEGASRRSSQGSERCAARFSGRPAASERIKSLMVHLLLTFLLRATVVNAH